MNSVYKLIKSDLYRYYGKNNIIHLLTQLITNPGFKLSVGYRLANNYYKTRNIPMLFIMRIINHFIQSNCCSSIPYTCEIGPGLYIGHAYGIIVNMHSKMGKNINISQFVTIGQTNRGIKQGVPSLGNKIYIGPGAKVIGNIQIDDNVLIAANAVVVDNVKENSVVAGVPAVVKSLKGTEKYVTNTIY